MYRRNRTSDLAARGAGWRRWTAIIELFAHRRRGRRRVDVQDYRTIHRGLTEVCRSLADTADEPERAFYGDLEGLVQPWLDPGVLAKADREILLDLLNRCRAAERDLGGGARGLALLHRAAPVLVVPAALFVFRLSSWRGSGGWSGVPGRLQGWSESLWSDTGCWGDGERSVLLSMVIIAVICFHHLTSGPESRGLVIPESRVRNCHMRTARGANLRGGHPRQGTAAVEMAMILPVFMLIIMGCIDFGRFAYTFIAVTNAARAGAGVGIMSHYPDPDPTTGNGLADWRMRICEAVANELGLENDFTPAGSGDPGGYTNSQGLYVNATRYSEVGGLWRAQVTARYPFTWWGVPSNTAPQQTVVYRAIR